MIRFRLARKKNQSADLTTPPKASPVTKHKDPVTPQNQNRRTVIGGGGGGGGSGVGNGNVSMSREASTASPTRGSGAQSPTLPAMAFSLCVVFFKVISGLLLIAAVDRDGERYLLDDDDVLSSGQVSPLSTRVLCLLIINYLIKLT